MRQMAAIGTEWAEKIRSAAREAGITDEQLSALVQERGWTSLVYCSRRDARMIETEIAERARAQRAALGVATERQVSYIVELLERRQASGVGGGIAGEDLFYLPTGRVDRAKVEQLSKKHASVLITSLKGEY